MEKNTGWQKDKPFKEFDCFLCAGHVICEEADVFRIERIAVEFVKVKACLIWDRSMTRQFNCVNLKRRSYNVSVFFFK
jgi:hypothetical protein